MKDTSKEISTMISDTEDDSYQNRSKYLKNTSVLAGQYVGGEQRHSVHKGHTSTEFNSYFTPLMKQS